MAEKIRGITIELGGDASGLSSALKGVNSEINNTQKQLKDVEKLLKLDPKNTELLAQKQKLLGDQIKNTSAKLETLKKAQDTMDQNGVDKNSAQYLALQREIISTETEMKSLKKASNETEAAMSKVGQAAEKVSKATKTMADKTKALSAAAGGLLTAIGGLAIKTAQDADELMTLAKQTGFTTDELQKFAYASDLVDVSLSDITGAATKLKKAVASDSDALKKLGVATKDAAGRTRDINDVFYDTLKALSRIPNETDRDAAAMEVFGKSADSLAGIVDDGGAALRGLGDEAEQLGLILSGNTLQSLGKTNDELDKLKATAKARLAETGAKALEALLPVIEQVVDIIDRVLEDISQLTPAQLETITTILAVIAVISPLMSVISSLSGLIAQLPALITAVSTAFTFLASNPIVLVIAAIVALVAVIALNWDKVKSIFKSFNDWLTKTWPNSWKQVFGPVLGGIIDKFTNTIKTKWEQTKQYFNNVIGFIRGVFTGNWSAAWSNLRNIFSSIVSGIESAFKAPLNGIIRMVNAVIDGLNWLIKQANAVSQLFGGKGSIGTIGHIPMLASGGVMTRGTAIVGERGPELLSVNNGKAVVQPLSGGSGASAARPIYITVQSVLDGKVIGKSTTIYQERTAKARG